jgi:DNA processing protein
MRALLENFGKAEAVLQATERDLCKVRGIGKKTAQAIHNIDLRFTDAQIARWRRDGVGIITMDDDSYPFKLQELSDCPPTLFTLGKYQPVKSRHIAVVGTRKPSSRASQQATTIGHVLASEGAVVVSGMATGIDGITQQAALKVPNSYTIGILGSGVLKPYPPANGALAHMLRLYGTLMCEVSPDATVSTPALVARNRIISGLSDAVIIVETTTDGGAMHTAKAAIRQGRELYVIDNNASGNRHLLESGQAAAITADLGNLIDVI